MKKPQVMKIEIYNQRAEAIQLIQAVDGEQYENLEKKSHSLLIHANRWDWKNDEKYSIFIVKRVNINSRLSTLYYPIAYNFDKDRNWNEKYTRFFGQ